MKPRSGVTLIEILVTSALVSLLGILIFNLLFPTIRTSLRVSVHAKLRQKGILVRKWLGKDLLSATPQRCGVSTTPPILATQPVETFSVDGSVIWAQQMNVYHLSGNRLYRTERVGSGLTTIMTLDPIRAVRPSPSELAALAAIGNRSRIIAQPVRSFSVTHGGTGENVASPVTVDLELGKTGPEAPPPLVMRYQYSLRMGER